MKKNLKVLLISLLLSLPFWCGVNFFQENLEKFFYAQITQPLEEINLVKIPEKTQEPNLELQARAAISMKVNEVGREKILFKKNIDQPLPIASLTKLMTAVIVLDYNPPTTLPAEGGAPNKNYDLENSWVISEKAANQENVPNYGNLDSQVGKKLKVKDLLDLMLIYSSNDAAWALSEVIGPDYFVEEMNQKANDLGLANTHFVNPTGLDPDDLHYDPDPAILHYFNYSSVKDLTKLAQYILKERPLIFELSRQKHLYLLQDGIFDLFLTQEVVGGKTGYTDEADGCILFVFKDENGNLFINVILGAPSFKTRIEEMQKLIDWLQI